jgi:roundabout, axon guidance receptor 2
VYVKWKAPAAKHHNGALKSYNVVVRGVNVYENVSKVLTNITIDASSSSIMLANLTEGVTYTVSVSAVNRLGAGPYSSPAILRLDPLTKKLDTSFTYRFPLHNDHSDDFLTKPWFIILLGTILVIIMLSFGVMVFIKRKHMLMKQSAFNGLSGGHRRRENFRINYRNLCGNSFTEKFSSSSSFLSKY